MPRLPTEFVQVFTGDVFSPGTKTYSPQFPLSGEGYRKLRLTFYHTVVIGTGATPIVLSEYNIVKNITFRTDRGETTHQIPAQGLYYFNWLFNHCEPVHTAMAAANGIYKAVVDIPFSFPFMARAEDLQLDTGRYNSVELEISLGTIADLFGAPGTATVATTLDVSVIRSKACAFPGGKPKFLPYIKHLPPFDPTARAYADIESAVDLNLFGFCAVAQSGGTVVAGVPFTGVPIDCLDQITFKDNFNDYVKGVNVNAFAEERKQYSLTDITGLYPFALTQEGSFMNALWTGKKSELKFEIGAVVGAPATPQVDLFIFGMRDLKD